MTRVRRTFKRWWFYLVYTALEDYLEGLEKSMRLESKAVIEGLYKDQVEYMGRQMVQYQKALNKEKRKNL